MNVRNHIDGLKDIAKYAYVALIEGWCTLPTPYHLWENEYNLLFGPYEPEKLDIDLERLKALYDITYNKYKDEKGKKGNNLLGSDINHIIESDYSIEQQLEATEYYLKQVFDELGINNDFKETMARNELMAKYMVQQSSFQDTIKDYEVTIKFMEENLQRGTQEPKNTHTVVTSDFQVLEFDYKMDKMESIDSDDDGLKDDEELGNEKWIDITEFAKKTYEDAKLNGKPHKTTFELQIDDIIKKNGGYIDKNNNEVNGSVKWNDDRKKVLYRVYDYKSNPMLYDTDFDGFSDTIDVNSIDNKLKGKVTDIGDVEFNQDFRWFFTNANKYNDELCTMSLIVSALTNDNLIFGENMKNTNEESFLADINISQYLNKIGFNEIKPKNEFRINDFENIKGKLYLSKKTIQIGANKRTVKEYKDVYGIFLGGFDTEENYKKLLANFDKEEVASFYENIIDDIMEYINSNKPSTINDYCYWVTGYSIAGGIAGEIASRLSDEAEVYCYTFGATNTNTSGSGAYACIKNVINEDDLYPKIYNVEDGFHRSGMLYNDSIYDNLKQEYRQLVGNVKKYNATPKLTNTIKKKLNKVRDNVTYTNYVNDWNTELSSYLKHYFKILNVFYVWFGEEFHPFQSHFSTELVNILNNNIDEVKIGHDIKSYYVLSKSLDGFDLNNSDTGWTEYEEEIESDDYIDELTEEDEEYQERLNLLLKSIEDVGKAYLDNVYTYQGADDTMWDIETRITDLDTTRKAEHVTEIITGQERVLKTSTVEAYEKWNNLKERIKNKYYPDMTFDEFKLKRIMPMNPSDPTSPKSLHHLDIFEDYKKSKKFKVKNYDKDMDVLYKEGDEDYMADKGSFVSDDCSSFATAVYWYYLNHLEEPKDLEKIDLWYTGSSYFIKKSNNSQKPKILDILLKNDFELYKWEIPPNNVELTEDYITHNIYLNTDFILQPGDLLYRSSGKNGASAHVEFYLGENNSFGWGEIHSTYENKDESKHFKLIRNLDSYNIGKTITADKASDGDIYRIDEKCKPGIYNTVYRKTDNNCRYDYVIRLKKKTKLVEVGDE